MKKVITARDVIEAHGLNKNTFDTNGFLNTIGEYFMENPQDDILLVKERFDRVSLYDYETNPHDLKEKDLKRGYKLSEFDYSDYKGVEPEACTEEWYKWLGELPRKIYVVKMFIDSPFYGNAVSLLEVMGGYAVKDADRKKGTGKIVSLM